MLPSSVHEIIVVPSNSKIPPADLLNMVQVVNKIEVSPEEKLSDSLYFYDAKEKKCQLPAT